MLTRQTNHKLNKFKAQSSKNFLKINKFQLKNLLIILKCKNFHQLKKLKQVKNIKRMKKYKKIDLLDLLNKKGSILKKHSFPTATLSEKMKVQMKIVYLHGILWEQYF
jgi:hypothetical protein